jgi:hypothetical protein
MVVRAAIVVALAVFPLLFILAVRWCAAALPRSLQLSPPGVRSDYDARVVLSCRWRVTPMRFR